ncbi:Hid-1 family protein P19A11.07c [Gossypium arboreum]|uniref:Hid-1 family protein P19A11.07c n=1 Tax=Gossypium arboreum TaxID=29729 RepID=A0A0B0MMY6_GOSAR|nr:Hid-1 family protein P19A11.07c [Gossypium arboreum]
MSFGHCMSMPIWVAVLQAIASAAKADTTCWWIFEYDKRIDTHGIGGSWFLLLFHIEGRLYC